MKKNVLLCFILFMLFITHSVSASTDLAIGGNSFSMGYSKRINGIHIDLADNGGEKVNGLNLTLWEPEFYPFSEINGIAIGLITSKAEQLKGISIGGSGTYADKMSGTAKDGFEYGTEESKWDHYLSLSLGGVYDGFSHGAGFGGINLSLSYTLRAARLLMFATFPDFNGLSHNPDNYDWRNFKTNLWGEVDASDCIEQSTGRLVSDDLCNQVETNDLAYSGDLNFLLFNRANSPFAGIGTRVGTKTVYYLSLGWFSIKNTGVYIKLAIGNEKYYQLSFGGAFELPNIF